tara:strand:- start:418 stop:1227 length:810 start_codon:yes stop_codon:yes gene_type:complete
MKKILLIGCGHMGNALLSSWLSSNSYSLTIIDPIKYNSLKKKYKKNKIKIFKSIKDLEKSLKFDFIILATKPRDLDNALSDLLATNLQNISAIVSIVAGKKINVFERKFKNVKNFFRVMPNMPASIGESMNCIVSNKEANKIKKNQVIKLFSCSGKTLFLENENQIDMATAISGSGPGFVFKIIDSMQKAAVNLGFKKKIAGTLVLETFKGSIHLLSKSKMSAQELVKTVATKGGTTEAGIKLMKKKNIDKIFIELTKASYKRAKEQGK